MRRLAVLLPILVLLGLAAVPPSAPPAVAAAAACPANPAPPNPADPGMVLTSPVAGATVTSPVHLTGFARVFEAHVDIQILGASGMVLVETFTMSSEAGPTLAPFTADVPFTVLTAQAGCIRVFAYSPADGTPRDVVQIEVNLAPSGAVSTATPAATPTPGPVTPPSTGDAGLAGGRGTAILPGAIVVVLAGVLSVRLLRRGVRA